MAMLATVKHNRAPMARPIRGPDESTYPGRLAARLKSLRIKAGYDHEQAAEAITKAGWAVSTPTIYRWEQGKSAPVYAALPYIADAYGCSDVRLLLPKD